LGQVFHETSSVRPSGKSNTRGGTVPTSNTRSIRGSCGGDVPIERCRRDTEAMRDLRHADVGIGQHRLGGLDVVICEFRRTAPGAASAPRGGKARLGALRDQAALESANAQRCSASRRISRYNPASSARNRRISVAISLFPITTRHSRHQHTWAGKDGPWPSRLQRVQAVSTRPRPRTVSFV
jgi:hypothetical protein